MIARLLSLLLLISATGSAAAHEFEDLVKAIERHYGAKRTHIPLMGAANLFVKVAHPAGTSGFKLALFDNFSLGDEDAAQLNRFMEAAGGSLHPTIRTHSRGGEATFLYTGEVGRSTRVLIATFERNQATVVGGGEKRAIFGGVRRRRWRRVGQPIGGDGVGTLQKTLKGVPAEEWTVMSWAWP